MKRTHQLFYKAMSLCSRVLAVACFMSALLAAYLFAWNAMLVLALSAGVMMFLSWSFKEEAGRHGRQ